MKDKCIERLRNKIIICFDEDGYRYFCGEVFMAYHLGLLTHEEKMYWLNRAAEEKNGE